MTHVRELDVLRGIAVLLVFLSHFWILWPGWVFHQPFAQAGFLGVDLFFVLSGFLITVLCLDEQRTSGTLRVGDFYRRRALRLFPALWVLLAAHAIYAATTSFPPFGRSDFEWGTIQAGLLQYMNWRALDDPLAVGDLSPLWSLSIEVQFYVVWPLVLLTVLHVRQARTVVLTVLGTALVGVVLHRLALFHSHGWEAAYLRSDARLDGLLLGALAGTAWVRGWLPERLPRWAIAPAVIAGAWIFVGIRADRAFAYQAGIPLFVIATAVVVLVVVSNPRRHLGPVGSTFAVLGQLSYGIYLWHVPVFRAFERWGSAWTPAVRTLLALAVVAAAVLLSRALVELPASRLRRAPAGAGRPAHGSPHRR